MTKNIKPEESKISPDQVTDVTKKDEAELSEAELNEISGGPTAVEMPVRLVH